MDPNAEGGPPKASIDEVQVEVEVKEVRLHNYIADGVATFRSSSTFITRVADIFTGIELHFPGCV